MEYDQFVLISSHELFHFFTFFEIPALRKRGKVAAMNSTMGLGLHIYLNPHPNSMAFEVCDEFYGITYGHWTVSLL